MGLPIFLRVDRLKSTVWVTTVLLSLSWLILSTLVPKKPKLTPHVDWVNLGQDVFSRTAYYIGPQGIWDQNTNGLNCAHCHLENGTKSFGIMLGGAKSSYPRWNERAGKIMPFNERLNACIQRSLNGQPLPETHEAMRALIAYLGSLKQPGPDEKRLGAISPINRPADPEKGRSLYLLHCQTCHGKNGEGVKSGPVWTIPPLFGEYSYNQGAGFYRLTKLAAFIRYNMPKGVNPKNPKLSEEEAFDLAAFINSRERPGFDSSKDWLRMEQRPFDDPFGPHADTYSFEQHKYGPFLKGPSNSAITKLNP